MRRTTLPALGLCLALLGSAACGGDDDEKASTGGTRATSTTDASGSSTSTTAPGSTDDTTDPGDTGGTGGSGGSGTTGGTGGGAVADQPRPRITLDVHGGFVPVEVNVAQTADVVVTADGSLISGAPTTMQYPGRAMAAFQVTHPSAGDIAALVQAIEALDPKADYSPKGQSQVADAPDTTLTLHRDDGTSVSFTAYALGFDPDGAEKSGPRGKLSAVVDRLNDLASKGTGSEAFQPKAFRVHDITDRAGDPPSGQANGMEPSGRILDWPIAASGAACSLVTEAKDVAAVRAVVDGATQLDWFRTDQGPRRLLVVPLLPGDPGCPKA